MNRYVFRFFFKVSKDSVVDLCWERVLEVYTVKHPTKSLSHPHRTCGAAGPGPRAVQLPATVLEQQVVFGLGDESLAALLLPHHVQGLNDVVQVVGADEGQADVLQHLHHQDRGAGSATCKFIYKWWSWPFTNIYPPIFIGVTLVAISLRSKDSFFNLSPMYA